MMERPKPSSGDVILLESLTKSTNASCFGLAFIILSVLLWWKLDGSFDFADIKFGAFWTIIIITMKRGFEQENRYTLSKHATEFKNKVTLSKRFPSKCLDWLHSLFWFNRKAAFLSIILYWFHSRSKSWLRMMRRELRFMKLSGAIKGKP